MAGMDRLFTRFLRLGWVSGAHCNDDVGNGGRDDTHLQS